MQDGTPALCSGGLYENLCMWAGVKSCERMAELHCPRACGLQHQHCLRACLPMRPTCQHQHLT